MRGKGGDRQVTALMKQKRKIEAKCFLKNICEMLNGVDFNDEASISV